MKREREKMKRERKVFSLTGQRLVSSLMAFAMSFALLLLPLDAYAYDAETYEVEPSELIWYVDNDVARTGDVKVILYMLVQPDSSYEKGGAWSYDFWCSEGYFDYCNGWEDTSAQMSYKFNAANKNIIDSTEAGNIWTWQFCIEEGKYIFALCNGNDNYISTLTSSLGSPYDKDGYSEDTQDIVAVKKGDTVVLYCLYGDVEWKHESLPVLQEWARKHQETLGNGRTDVDTEVTSEETITVEQDATPAPEMLETEDVQEEAPVAIEEETTIAEKEEVIEEEKESPLKTILVSGPIVLVLLIACFVIKKKDEEKNSEVMRDFDEESTK